MFKETRNLAKFIQEVRAYFTCLVALIVPPIVGIILITCTTGQFRLIGVGLLVYTFAFFVVLPGLIYAAVEKPGSKAKLLASIACFILAVFTYFYQLHASTSLNIIGLLFSMVPIVLLGIGFAGWWIYEQSRLDKE